MFAVIVDKDLDVATKEMRYVMLCKLVLLLASLLTLVLDKYGYADGCGQSKRQATTSW
jgi:hypothetical protein